MGNEIISVYTLILGFPGGSDGKESACNAEDWGSIPGLGRSPGEGNSNPLQYSGLENPMDRGAWWATVPGVAKESDMTEQLTLLINTTASSILDFFRASLVAQMVKILPATWETWV